MHVHFPATFVTGIPNMFGGFNAFCVAMLIALVSRIDSREILDVTESNFQQSIKDKKFVFLYATTDDCEKCNLQYYKFVAASQNFANDKDTFFGRVADKALLAAMEADKFPQLVFYKHGSATPESYRGDITTAAITTIVADAMKRNTKSLKPRYTVQLTGKNFEDIMSNDKQYRLIMLHEAGDDDDVNTFEKVSETFDNELSVVIARVNVDFEKKLRRQYNAIEFPSFYWYPAGSTNKKMRYGGTLDPDQMIGFINKEAGLLRLKGGNLNHRAGLIKPLDEVVKKFVTDLYEIRNFDKIRSALKKVVAKLPADVDSDLVEWYMHLIDEVEEDRTIEALDESRSRLYREMDQIGPLQMDRLVRKRNIVQKIIDLIGNHLLEEMTGGNMGDVIDSDQEYASDKHHGITLHDEF